MIVCELPLNANGKIDRKALPAPELVGASSSASYLAPRTPIEEVLVEIWKRVLGLGQIGIHDNFFDMGGNSLLAVRLITEVHKSAGHRFSVASFFQDPTIAHMGSVLQEEKRAETEEEDKALHVVLRHGTKSLAIIPADAPLLTIQEGGRLPPFFVVDSFPYFIDVVRLLDEDQPVLSLVSRERAQATSSYNIAEEAARHVQTILSLPPHGPIMLGGCSASGIIAYEAARQLHDRGHKVGLVVLFDTVNPHFMRDRSALRRSLAYSGAVLKRMRWNKGPGWMAAKIGSLISTKAGVLARRTGGTHSNQGSSPQFGLSPSRIDAARRYHPGPYSGRVLVFKGERGLGGRYLDPQFGWGDVVHGKLEAYQLCSSEHLEIFKSESDRALVAGKLREAFDEVAASFRAFADRRIELSASTQYEASPNGHGEAARAGESGSLYRPSLMPASKLIGGDG